MLALYSILPSMLELFLYISLYFRYVKIISNLNLVLKKNDLVKKVEPLLFNFPINTYFKDGLNFIISRFLTPCRNFWRN